jgi:hypothetical protein
MKKGKVIVPLALCVCVVLIVIGIALGNNPMRSSIGQGQAAEVIPSEESKASESSDETKATESATSSNEDPNAGLTSEQIMMGEYWYNDDPSTYNGPSEEMLALAKSMTPKELYENTYDRKPEWMKSRQTYHILREYDGTLTTESGESPIYHADNGLNIEVTDVHASNTLEYGLTEEDGWFGEECGLDESGTITSPDYVFVYTTLRLTYNGKIDHMEFLAGDTRLVQYNLDGYTLDASENRCNKHILQSGIAEKTTAEEDPRDSGHIWVHAGETRDVLCVMLMQNNFTFVITDYEAAKRDGVHDLLDEEKYYTLATYEENEFKYAFTISDYGVTAVEFDVTEIVNDWFAA